MSPSPGTPKQLGPYEILSPLGAGGMGEVYRAKDGRLRREVAVKILRGDFANDAALKARFEREAQLVAALSHPNIVALFEVGSVDGVEYTVSELVDGQSLRSLLQQEGAVPVRRVVELALQVADGMAAAHAAGIVHRDLKPENVMVTRDGRVKILDFGLARQVNAVSGAAASGSSETIVVPAETIVAPAHTLISGASAEYRTNPGMVLGTAAYMSPEQAKGLEADYRSDQFSFGLMVYEMLAGRQAFLRGSAVETMAAIVRDEPEPLDARIPVTLRWIVERCLEKDAGQRFDSTKDLYQQLRMLRDHYSEAFSSSMQPVSAEVLAAQASAQSKAVWIWPVALVAGLAVGGVVAWLLHPRGVELGAYKYTPFAVNARRSSWSPDGKTAAYSADVERGDGSELFLRSIDSSMPQQLTHSGGNVSPVGWSGDASHILYYQTLPTSKVGTVESVATVGGEPETVWTLPGRYNTIAISPDGTAGVTLAPDNNGLWDLYISQPIGAALRRYPDSHVESHGYFNNPQLGFSKDGKQLLVIAARDSGSEEAWLLPWPAGTGTPKQVLQTMPHENGTPTFSWLSDNRHLLVSTALDLAGGLHLFVADTQSDRLRQITQGTASESNPTVSPDVKSILFAQISGDMDILSMSLADGSTQPLIATARMEAMPAWSKSGDLVYVSDRSGPDEIWLHPRSGVDHSIVTRKMFAGTPPKWMFAPVLSPDGSRVIFVTVMKTGEERLWEASVNGGSPVQLIDPSEMESQSGGDWSPDGKQFVYTSFRSDGKEALETVRTSGGAKSQVLAMDGSCLPSFSPDGQWIAYSGQGNDWHLISLDGKTRRDLGVIDVQNMGWGADSKTLHGIRAEAGKFFLFSLDVAGSPARLHDIKQLDSSLRPVSNLNPGIRFTLAPDGKTFAYAIGKGQSSLWLLQGWE